MFGVFPSLIGAYFDSCLSFSSPIILLISCNANETRLRTDVSFSILNSGATFIFFCSLLVTIPFIAFVFMVLCFRFCVVVVYTAAYLYSTPFDT